MVEEAGLVYAPAPDVVPRSRRALELAEVAREQGRFEQVHEQLMTAYWTDGRNIEAPEVLRDVAARAGLDVDGVDAVAADAASRRVDESTREALDLGINGVPAWLIDSRLLVPGAQPHALFEHVMERLGHAPLQSAGG